LVNVLPSTANEPTKPHCEQGADQLHRPIRRPGSRSTRSSPTRNLWRALIGGGSEFLPQVVTHVEPVGGEYDSVRLAGWWSPVQYPGVLWFERAVKRDPAIDMWLNEQARRRVRSWYYRQL